MAGHAAQVELSARPAGGTVRVVAAAPGHDPAIRRLLRENPTRGRISLSFEREPGFFRSVGIAGDTDTSILAFDGDRLVCMGRCTIRDRHVAGEPRRVGYLGELRLDHSAAGRSDILRRGYSFFAEQQAADPADLYFTSVASDNLRARHLLERGARGFPRYRHLCDFVTLILAVPMRGGRAEGRPAVRWEPATAADRPAIARFLNARGSGHELTSVWTGEGLAALQDHGLAPEDIWIVRDCGRIDACVALWDQRSFRQTVIRGYSRALRLARPLINLGADLMGREGLPPVGSILRLAYLSPFAISQGSEGRIVPFIESLYPAAARRGIAQLALGFDASDPRAAVLERGLRPREYHCRLYEVSLRGAAARIPAPGPRLFEPEVAFL